MSRPVLRRLSAGLLAGLLAAAPLAAQVCDGPSLAEGLTAAERAALAAEVAATPHAEGLLWEARRGTDRIVLVGTMHLADPRHAALLARLEPVVAEAEVLLLEMTPVELDEMQRQLATDPGRLYIEAGPTLIDLMAPEDWAIVAEAARARQIPPFMAARFRPWFLMLTLSIPPCAMPAMAAGEGGLDMMLMDLAEARGVPMRALEPWDTLFTLIEGVPEAEQIDLLRASVMAPDLQSALFVAMLDGYFAGRIGEVWALSRVALGRMEGITPDLVEGLMAQNEDLLLDRRNRAWIGGIEAAAEAADRIVVAVGAAHLPREAGVLRLLEAEGWTVAPLR